jgi:hypothetical protein
VTRRSETNGGEHIHSRSHSHSPLPRPSKHTKIQPTQGPSPSHHHARARARLGFPSWGWQHSPPPYRPPRLTPYHIFATTLDLNHEGLPSAGADGAASSPDAAIMQGLAAWIPSPRSTTEPYHLYVIAVQRCRVLARLRLALQEHLGTCACLLAWEGKPAFWAGAS